MTSAVSTRPPTPWWRPAAWRAGTAWRWRPWRWAGRSSRPPGPARRASATQGGRSAPNWCRSPPRRWPRAPPWPGAAGPSPGRPTWSRRSATSAPAPRRPVPVAPPRSCGRPVTTTAPSRGSRWTGWTSSRAVRARWSRWSTTCRGSSSRAACRASRRWRASTASWPGPSFAAAASTSPSSTPTASASTRPRPAWTSSPPPRGACCPAAPSSSCGRCSPPRSTAPRAGAWCRCSTGSSARCPPTGCA